MSVFAPDSAVRGIVSLVGAGPGDPGLLTVKAARLLAEAEVLVYDALASPPIVALAPPGCERIYVGKRARAHAVPQDEITAMLVRLGASGKRVVRLKGGDPFVFGRGGEEAQALRAGGVAFEIVPGISSAVAAPAYAGIPVTHRSHNTSFVVATGHEDPTKGETTLDYATLGDANRTVVFLMAMGHLGQIADALQAHGRAATTPVAVIQHGTTPAQRTLVGTLGAIAREAEAAGMGAPAIVVVGEVVTLRKQIAWFDERPLFGKRVLITRPAGEAAAGLARRLWELGAEPLLAPTIAIEPPTEPAAARRAVRELRTYEWVVLTSANGVAALFTHLDAIGADARAFGAARVAAIGPATSAALRARGIIADLRPESAVGESLAAALVARTSSGARVLIFRAEDARDVVPATLLEAGREVDVIAAYRTRACTDPSIAGEAERADVWTFASASAVDAFVANVPGAIDLARDRTVACIGPATAEAARRVGLAPDATAEEFTADGLLAALLPREVPT